MLKKLRVGDRVAVEIAKGYSRESGTIIGINKYGYLIAFDDPLYDPCCYLKSELKPLKFKDDTYLQTKLFGKLSDNFTAFSMRLNQDYKKREKEDK